MRQKSLESEYTVRDPQLFGFRPSLTAPARGIRVTPMLKQALSEATVRCDVDVADGEAAIDTLLDLICGAGAVKDREIARRDVLENERRSSTGMQHGVAIPHAKTEAVVSLQAAVIVTREPVDFDSLDGKPSRIFVMTLSPLDQEGPHLRFLAEIGRLLKHRKVRSRILAARTPRELLNVFLEE